MVFDLRYHLASLVSVFLALSLGVLIGTTIVDHGGLLQEQEQLIASIETRLQSLRDEQKGSEERHRQLVASLERYELFAEQALSPLIQGKLTGRNLAVLVEGREAGTEAQLRAMINLLESGGGKVSAAFRLPAEANEKAVKDWESFFVSLTDRSGENRAIPPDLQSALSEAQVENGKIDGIVFVMGNRKATAPVVNMLNRLNQEVMTVVGHLGDVESLGSTRVAQVAHVQTPYGKTALVWSLASRQNGIFGTLTSGASLLPGHSEVLSP